MRISPLAGKPAPRLDADRGPSRFKWFVDGLPSGSIGAGEESAGASFARTDGTPWTTDKDWIILGLLAAETTARLDHDPGALYVELTRGARRAGVRADRCPGHDRTEATAGNSLPTRPRRKSWQAT